MVLVGIWQGKGSPLQYMNAFGEKMCSLYEEGIAISIEGSPITVTGLQITNGQAPVTLSGQTCFYSDTTRFWPVKF